ncbi:hypothetical protein [Streptomyces sp. 6-11-2]|uniref:hypothetical protein n=1 Tax=Streptomyces sp. 6-11-2 TaxID=2585753 RepID=UPI001143307C|nr:hypothetical protein [Streptomyces sp. 6-11-2]GED89328.1 hypothetical protein TNCT6_64130 [Streptomyces sp. 6-11-2]
MLEIGLQGLAFALTLITIAALKKGGKSFPSPLAFAVGIVLAYVYARAGQPWSILSVKAHDMTGRIGDHFGAVPAAVALGLAGWWHYTRPGAKGSVLQGFLMTSAALAANGLLTQVTSMIGSLVQVVAG